MKRRGFFKRLFGKEVDTSMLAVQIVMHEYALPGLRQQLYTLVEDPYSGAQEQTPETRKAFYKRIVGLISQCEPFFEYGLWEYVDDKEAAIDGFHEWVTEIEAELATEDTETGEEVDDMHRLSAEKTYVAVTFVFLLGHAVPLAEELDPEDGDSWTRQTFYHLINTFATFDYERLQADAVYIVPGTDEDGLSEMDLIDEGWSHLEILS